MTNIGKLAESMGESSIGQVSQVILEKKRLLLSGVPPLDEEEAERPELEYATGNVALDLAEALKAIGLSAYWHYDIEDPKEPEEGCRSQVDTGNLNNKLYMISWLTSNETLEIVPEVQSVGEYDSMEILRAYAKNLKKE